ncbi:hypothetical protein [Croceicoccus mobilis]|uniref:Uncharacterized protein n=1 Tax=Croceicoccus mobilis TaxID=1703339 RepID=A0A916YW33_9SPHN|nr:hypothetical protein [Croceicoccus mobilis]GGD63250.1 hypothetical protein GCM10010990_10900 [Croceicoccus mobilis]
MKNLLMAGAAMMLGAAPMAVHAQDAVGGSNTASDKKADVIAQLNAEQQAEFETLSPEYQTTYVAWPAEYRTSYWSWPADSRTTYWTWPTSYQDYYWSLEPAQQNVYWAMTADQRSRIDTMTPAQRAQAWAAINQQMAANSASASTSTSASTGMSASTTSPKMVMKSGEMAQPMAATPKTPDSEYPLCTDGRTDSCVNPRAAGKNYGNKPLDYWPGQPASEMGS